MRRELPHRAEMEEAVPDAPAASPQVAWIGAGSLNPQALLALQRSVGNAAVNGILRSAVVQRCGGAAGCGCELCATQAVDPEDTRQLLEDAESLEAEPDQGVEGMAVEGLEGGGAESGAIASVGGPEDEMAETEAPAKADATMPAQRDRKSVV